MQARLDHNPDAMRLRRSSVEPLILAVQKLLTTVFLQASLKVARRRNGLPQGYLVLHN
jgi:hypothetical protein